MDSRLALGKYRRSLLAFSILAISVVAAISSVGIAFAATSSSSSTTTGSSAASGSQTSAAGSNAASSSSTTNCPNMGGGPSRSSANGVTSTPG